MILTVLYLLITLDLYMYYINTSNNKTSYNLEVIGGLAYNEVI